MSLNPSLIAEQVSGIRPFPNAVGQGRRDPQKCDAELIAELRAAGIEWYLTDDHYGEVGSAVLGVLRGWTFRRAWHYWVANATGPRLSLEHATTLHESHGKSVRVGGYCGCLSPEEYCGKRGVESYHVYNPTGLEALADTLRAVSVPA